MTDHATRTKFHHDVVDHLLDTMQRRFGATCYVEKQSVINTRDERGYFVRAHHVGIADVGGFTMDGRAWQIEVKTGSGVLFEEQSAWANYCKTMGVYHDVVKVEGESDVDGAVVGCVERLAAKCGQQSGWVRPARPFVGQPFRRTGERARGKGKSAS